MGYADKVFSICCVCTLIWQILVKLIKCNMAPKVEFPFKKPEVSVFNFIDQKKESNWKRGQIIHRGTFRLIHGHFQVQPVETWCIHQFHKTTKGVQSKT